MTAALSLAAVCALATAVDIIRFVAHPAADEKLWNGLQLAKLGWIAAIYALLAAGLTTAAWRTRANHRAAAAEPRSAGHIVLWTALAAYVWAVYYPLPPHRHHADKILLFQAVVGAWLIVFLWRPAALTSVIEHRAVAWGRVAAVNVLLFVLIGETALRLADPWLARQGLFGDARTPAWLTPHREVDGSIRYSNSLGFRDRERSINHGPDQFRVIALGDSFTWGAGVSYDETFVTLIERALAHERSGTEVINLGVPGFAPEHELDLLSRYGLELDPDVVVLNFCIANDIVRRRGYDADEMLAVSGRTFFVHHNGNVMHDRLGLDRSFLYHNVRYLWTMLSLKRSPPPTVSTNAALAAPMGLEWTRYLQFIDEHSDIYQVVDTPIFEQHWRHTRAMLDQIRDALSRRGVPLVLVLIPDPVQVNREQQAAFLHAVGAGAQDYDFVKPQRVLKAWARQAGVEVIDLYDAFEASANPPRMYLVNDGHWSVEGHVLAARIIAPVLSRQLQALNASRGTRIATRTH